MLWNVVKFENQWVKTQRSKTKIFLCQVFVPRSFPAVRRSTLPVYAFLTFIHYYTSGWFKKAWESRRWNQLRPLVDSDTHSRSRAASVGPCRRPPPADESGSESGSWTSSYLSVRPRGRHADACPPPQSLQACGGPSGPQMWGTCKNPAELREAAPWSRRFPER